MKILALLLPVTALACAPAQTPPPPVTSNVVATSAPAPAPPRRDHVYRLDFVLTTNDGAAPIATSSFTLNLLEQDVGEVTIGKNVALNPTSSSRQDVGVKVRAVLKRMLGDEPFLETELELSSFDPPSTVRKVVSRGDALAADGKPALVASLDDDKKHYQLTVTPTKLR